jgi:hypothetical protein
VSQGMCVSARPARETRLKPFEYLKHVFETMPNISPDEYAALLPWSKTLPERCKLDPKGTE